MVHGFQLCVRCMHVHIAPCICASKALLFAPPNSGCLCNTRVPFHAGDAVPVPLPVVAELQQLVEAGELHSGCDNES
jgi:hypothetical protein